MFETIKYDVGDPGCHKILHLKWKLKYKKTAML